MSLGTDLRARWEAEGIASPRGVSDEELSIWESHHGVRLPDDMRGYLKVVDGMYPEDSADENVVGFWPLELIRPVADELPATWDGDALSRGGFLEGSQGKIIDLAEARTLFQFADHSIGCTIFAIRLSATAPDRGAIYGVYMGIPGPCIRDLDPLAASFAEFVRRYLSEHGASLSVPPSRRVE